MHATKRKSMYAHSPYLKVHSSGFPFDFTDNENDDDDDDYVHVNRVVECLDCVVREGGEESIFNHKSALTKTECK